MNRQQRRAQKNQPKTQAQFDEDVYREGFRDGATSTFKMAYAAVCLVLHRDYGFGQGRCHKVLSALDAEMSPGGQLSYWHLWRRWYALLACLSISDNMLPLSENFF